MSASVEVARSYARDHADEFVAELCDMLRIPSLSGDPAHAGDVRKMADWLAAHMVGLGLDHVAVMETAGHPVVYGDWLGAGPDAPTILVYGHYDVVPASLEDGWDTDPFVPVIKDGRVSARGATDDKGQLFIHVKALQAWLQTSGAAPVNVKYLIEGEEEVSSPNLTPFIKEHLDLLRADVVVISDSSMRVIEEPAITHSLRGMTYLEIHVSGPKEDLHSGFYGGAVHNPAVALVQMLDQLYAADGTIAVPGFYDAVVGLTDAEREMIAKTGIAEDQLTEVTGVPAQWGDQNFTIKERVSARPTLDINGIWGGWAGPGPKTIIPSRAGAKLSSRLVANQDPHQIFELVRDFVASIAPTTVDVEVKLITTGLPALIPMDLPAMQAAARAYQRGWGHDAVFTRGGGSIPVVADFVDLLQVPVVMMGYGLDDDGLHAPNESYSLEMFSRGIETAIVYMDELAQLG
ncbi:MAG TPA: dipeptidase [Thermomicrobiales bacterium]|nr:dipeptidase [Thermomicrobiales bacterium]